MSHHSNFIILQIKEYIRYHIYISLTFVLKTGIVKDHIYMSQFILCILNEQNMETEELTIA